MLRALIQVLETIRRLLMPAVFTLEIRGGRAHVRSGTVPGIVVQEFSAVARDFGIRHGTICAVRDRQGPKLAFSAGIPPEAHQRLRNLFAVHRHRFPEPGSARGGR